MTTFTLIRNTQLVRFAVHGEAVTIETFVSRPSGPVCICTLNVNLPRGRFLYERHLILGFVRPVETKPVRKPRARKSAKLSVPEPSATEQLYAEQLSN